MIIHKGYEGLGLKRPVVAMGIFDGVHKGHKELIDRVVSCSEELNGESVVMTFFPHPRMVLEPENNDLFFLSTQDEKRELLENEGIDNMVIVDFTRKFSRIPASVFIKDVLRRELGTHCLIIGYDHSFGSMDEDKSTSIDTTAINAGIRVERVDSVIIDSIPVSSSVIRDLLLSGNVEKANCFLGYSYSLTGTVIEGRKMGRKIGFPTANISVADRHKLIPSDGVYAVRILLDGESVDGVLSIGVNPTISLSGERSIEVNIIDFGKNIYGKLVKISFVARLRNSRKFPGIPELALQIEEDRKNAIKILRHRS